MLKKLYTVLMIGLLSTALLSAVAARVAPQQTLAQKTKCRSYYYGGQRVAKICLTAKFAWDTTAPYAVACVNHTASYTIYNPAWDFGNIYHECRNLTTYSQAWATADLWRDDPFPPLLWKLDSGVGCVANDGQIGTITCWNIN